MNWSIDKDRKNISYFISQIDKVSKTASCIFSSYMFFVWYDVIFYHFFAVKALKYFFLKKIIAVSSNDIREYPEKFKKLRNVVDIWISPNSKISKYFKQENVKFIQIPFFVNPKTFYKIKTSKKEIINEFGVEFEKIKNKFLIGSIQRDSTGNNLLKPKWQKNPDLLFEIFKKIPKENKLLVLAGPRRHYLIERCRKENIPYLYIGNEKLINEKKDDITVNNLSEKMINKVYNMLDLYVVSSKSEGGPKAIIEASLTKTPIISTDVGLARDFLEKSQIIDLQKLNSTLHLSTLVTSALKSVEKNYDKSVSFFNETNYKKMYSKIFNTI